MSRYGVEMAECGSYVSESDQDSITSEENGIGNYATTVRYKL